jgi:hypothetical protein
LSGKRLAIFALIFSFSSALLAFSSSDAFAARGGGRNKPAPTVSGSLSLVLVDSTDGTAHWGQHVTFNVTSSAAYYFVRLDCYQGGVWVYEQTNGFYVGWLWTRNFTLASTAWSSGAADCTALLYSTSADGSNFQSLATMSFHVSQ